MDLDPVAVLQQAGTRGHDLAHLGQEVEQIMTAKRNATPS